MSRRLKSRSALKIANNDLMPQYCRKPRSELGLPDPKRDWPQPPQHLGDAEKAIWKHVFDDYDLVTKTGIDVLTTALEAHQRCRLAGEQIQKEGMTVTGRDGQLRPHPLLAVERDARHGYLAALKLIGLDL